jgi:hypothetical protein
MFYTNTKFTNDTSTILHLQSFANDLVDTQIPIQHANRGKNLYFEGQII